MTDQMKKKLQEAQDLVNGMHGLRKANAQRDLNFALMQESDAYAQSFLNLVNTQIHNFHWSEAIYDASRELVRAVMVRRSALPSYMAQAHK